VLCVVGSSWVGIAAGLGRAQALTWIAAMILFYLPMAVSVIYLNREMPLKAAFTSGPAPRSAISGAS
jgi:hypothetical protein